MKPEARSRIMRDTSSPKTLTIARLHYELMNAYGLRSLLQYKSSAVACLCLVKASKVGKLLLSRFSTFLC